MRDLIAERQILAMAVMAPDACRDRFLALAPGVFADGPHDVVATVLRDRLTRGIPIDPAVLAADAAATVGTDEKARRVGYFVAELAISATPLAAWDHYAERIQYLHTGREAAYHAGKLIQRLETIDDPADVVDFVRDAQDALTASVDGVVAAAAAPPMSLADLLDEPDEPYDWLVPGLLERMDRLILTGFEGTGKSYLLAQFALAIAGGVHPFRGHVFAPAGFRVLVMDLENSRRQMRRRYARIRSQVDHIRLGMSQIDWRDVVRFYHRPEGIDLSSGPEIARAERAIATTVPDLVIAGPLYRMHRLNLNDEPAAREIVAVLDRWRVKYGFTLIVEAHVGHVGETTGGRKLRPTGSSLFLRWPEFGFGLRAIGESQAQEHPDTVEVVAWRGSRDERDWPKMLRHGDKLPWEPSDPEYQRRGLEVVS